MFDVALLLLSSGADVFRAYLDFPLAHLLHPGFPVTYS